MPTQNQACWPQAQAEMRARQFEKATALADKAISAKDAASDALLFLKASAMYQSKKYPEAVSAADQLAKDFLNRIGDTKQFF